MSKIMEDMRNEALEEGIQKGREESAINTARKMLKDGTITLEKIAEFAGLSMGEVIKLKEE